MYIREELKHYSARLQLKTLTLDVQVGTNDAINALSLDWQVFVSVLHILVDNAVKFTRNNSAIKITIDFEPQENDDEASEPSIDMLRGVLRVQVHDAGNGFPV